MLRKKNGEENRLILDRETRVSLAMLYFSLLRRPTRHVGKQRCKPDNFITFVSSSKCLASFA